MLWNILAWKKSRIIPKKLSLFLEMPMVQELFPKVKIYVYGFFGERGGLIYWLALATNLLT